MVFFYPNVLGHSDNYIPADPMVTPASIVPEWYLLPFYAILRSIPNKLLGVIAMFGSLLILLILPLTDLSIIRGNQFRPAMKLAFWFFVVDFIILMWIGSQHPTTPFVEIGQVATAFYFSWFIIIVPIIGLLENTLFTIALDYNLNKYGNNPFASHSYNIKIFLGDSYSGIKRGWFLPVVSPQIRKLDTSRRLKLLKILGYISILILFTKSQLFLNGFLYYIILIFSTSFILYKFIFSLFAIKELYFYILTGKFLIKNSNNKLKIVESFFKFLSSTCKILFLFSINTEATYILVLDLYNRLFKV